MQTVFIIIGIAMACPMIGSNTLIEQDVHAQNMTNASNFTGVGNDSSSASVTARLNISSPEPEPEDYPIPSPTE
jgi:hypothetical protein